jgi:hypothetical protein
VNNTHVISDIHHIIARHLGIFCLMTRELSTGWGLTLWIVVHLLFIFKTCDTPRKCQWCLLYLQYRKLIKVIKLERSQNMTNRIWEKKSPEGVYALCSNCNDRVYISGHDLEWCINSFNKN